MHALCLQCAGVLALEQGASLHATGGKESKKNAAPARRRRGRAFRGAVSFRKPAVHLTRTHSLPPVNTEDSLLLVSNGSKWVAMRHGKKLPKLNRPANQRKALIRTLVTEVLRHGRITTTKVRKSRGMGWLRGEGMGRAHETQGRY
jgi:hypothetical protein